MKRNVLFDLGNTLVQYYVKSEFPGILKQAINRVEDYLREEKLLHVSTDSIWRRVDEENQEARDHAVRPLERRLTGIFQIGDDVISEEIITTMCRRFMKPIFALARLYGDVLPVLRELGKIGIRKVIVSNTPWGSPADLWREEIERLGLSKQVNLAVFCRDAGWRKPARQIFDYTLEKMQVEAQDCIFVGDDPRWDLVGPRSVGMEAILIDRSGKHSEEKAIRDLHELLGRL